MYDLGDCQLDGLKQDDKEFSGKMHQTLVLFSTDLWIVRKIALIIIYWPCKQTAVSSFTEVVHPLSTTPPPFSGPVSPQLKLGLGSA